MLFPEGSVPQGSPPPSNSYILFMPYSAMFLSYRKDDNTSFRDEYSKVISSQNFDQLQIPVQLKKKVSLSKANSTTNTWA